MSVTSGSHELSFDVSPRIGAVSAVLVSPPDARALYVLAHGAGAGMRHAFLERTAAELALSGVATFRFQFPYTEAGRRRPDPPAALEETVRAAVRTAAAAAPGLALFAGGKSMGGRMTSQAQAKEPLPGVRGLVFLGFPLHGPKRPAASRAGHLERVRLPMLFVQGTRDDLADIELMRATCRRLGAHAVLHAVEGGDHSFRVLKRSGRDEAAVMQEIRDTVIAFMRDAGRS
jgi:predicted alpha/beta-hydrolase family hydrolase